jgi:hypothetical protein
MSRLFGLFLVLSIPVGICLGLYSYKYVAKWYYVLLALLLLPYIILHYLSATSSNPGFDEARWIYFCGMIACLLTYNFRERADRKANLGKK